MCQLFGLIFKDPVQTPMLLVKQPSHKNVKDINLCFYLK
jgi:hypothetical protein